MINCKVMTDTNAGHVIVGGGALKNVLGIVRAGLHAKFRDPRETVFLKYCLMAAYTCSLE
jgi:hypothetical protein